MIRQSRVTGKGAASTFRHAEIFPIIAGLINELSGRAGGYCTHREIAQALLLNKAGRAQAEEAAQKQGEAVERVAGNMVAWFRKRFTEGQTDYQDAFERQRVGGRWAYRTARRKST